MKNVLEDQEGAVLIIVLIVLVASIIIGVMTIRTSIMESKMVTNEHMYINSFANLESAVNIIAANCDQALAALSTSTSIPYTTVANPGGASAPANQLPPNTSVTVTLESIGAPLPGLGYGANYQARYYKIQSSDTIDNQMLTVGGFMIFPPTQTLQ